MSGMLFIAGMQTYKKNVRAISQQRISCDVQHLNQDGWGDPQTLQQAMSGGCRELLVAVVINPSKQTVKINGGLNE